VTALLAEVVRSGYVEGTHTGSVVVLRPDGSVALGLGDLERPVFPRSSNKPLQAVALLDAGWEPASEEQLALATASHNGEPGHIEVVRAMLGELGEDALGNPPMPPLSEQAWHQILRAGGAATRLTMNCSGKHAAMLRTTVGNGWDLASYLGVEHPVQRACLHSVERLAGEHVRHVAVDGCGAPQHALTLPGLARAFSALVLGGEHERRTGAAMRAHPWHVGGTGRDVTRLMQGVPGLVAKDGAEGVYAAALPDGTAVALKIADGAGRARTPVLVAALRAVGVDAPVLDELATTPVLGGGVRVGEVRVAGKLAARG
jgi:L-asparaginase II